MHKSVNSAVWSIAALFAVTALSATAWSNPGRYIELEEFLEQAFPQTAAPDAPETLYIDASLRAEIESVLGHAFDRLRLRYWQANGTTAWVLDEIGKTEPITIGVAVRDGRVASVRVLEFRESRGWEIRYPFFTDQFTGIALAADNKLDASIDGITGATLSVTAADKIVRIALIFDARVREENASS